MSTQRIAYWWFRFVFSGRFLETFLLGRYRRMAESFVREFEPAKPQHDLPSPEEAARDVTAE
jgi:hypothetical protein